MTTKLQRKIRSFLNENNMSMTALERKAGLKINVVRNIITGQSKNPRTPTLYKLSEAMSCPLNDLLPDGAPGYISNSNSEAQITHPELLVDSMRAITTVMTDRSVNLTLGQVKSLLDEVYFYTIKRDDKSVDNNFVRWLIDKL